MKPRLHNCTCMKGKSMETKSKSTLFSFSPSQNEVYLRNQALVQFVVARHQILVVNHRHFVQEADLLLVEALRHSVVAVVLPRLDPEDEDLLPFDEEVDLHFHEEGVALPVVHLRSIRGIEDLVRVLVLLIVDHVLVLHVVVAAVH
ncbi:hypothetical protein AeRB84_014671 [Aphanomyces euteiches]|nr:hypothetical protein AeRB84_014671 [Aphanomyces euteiches]